MVAELRTEAAPLPLLFEPDRPADLSTRKSVQNGGIRSQFALDFGARVQHAIALYIVAGVSRPDVARFLGMSERQTQAVVLGRAWPAYSKPVLRALDRMGISLSRGRWYGPRARHHEIVAASQSVMRRAIDALEGAPIPLYDRDKLVSDLYLLTVAGEVER